MKEDTATDAGLGGPPQAARAPLHLPTLISWLRPLSTLMAQWSSVSPQKPRITKTDFMNPKQLFFGQV